MTNFKKNKIHAYFKMAQKYVFVQCWLSGYVKLKLKDKVGRKVTPAKFGPASTKAEP